MIHCFCNTNIQIYVSTTSTILTSKYVLFLYKDHLAVKASATISKLRRFMLLPVKLFETEKKSETESVLKGINRTLKFLCRPLRAGCIGCVSQ